MRVTLTAPVLSFRNHLYATAQVTHPCPPPSTVAGMLAAVAGGWGSVDVRLRFALAFHAAGLGVDLETYHPLAPRGKTPFPVPREREFLADTVATVWLLEDMDLWWQRLRRPVWPMRLGRSQDLVGIRLDHTTLAPGEGEQRGALVPAFPKARGTPLRLPIAAAPDHGRAVWGDFRHDATGRSPLPVPGSRADTDGQAVVLLPPVHPALHFTTAPDRP
ncbi:CRISPR-associated protein Cas5 [Kitasatospora sp. NA04385]|nr:CRISPR-associated protein Cas5 [Kitasatospora sp. NA04385]